MTFWGWFFQRITGLMLVFLVAAHVYLAYFASPGAVTYELVRGRIHSSILLVDLLLLYVALFHGLYGLRNVAADVFPKIRGTALNLALVVIGIGLSFYGTQTLTALL